MPIKWHHSPVGAQLGCQAKKYAYLESKLIHMSMHMQMQLQMHMPMRMLMHTHQGSSGSWGKTLVIVG